MLEYVFIYNTISLLCDYPFLSMGLSTCVRKGPFSGNDTGGQMCTSGQQQRYNTLDRICDIGLCI
jgi:hypothetical protein